MAPPTLSTIVQRQIAHLSTRGFREADFRQVRAEVAAFKIQEAIAFGAWLNEKYPHLRNLFDSETFDQFTGPKRAEGVHDAPASAARQTRSAARSRPEVPPLATGLAPA